MKYKQKIRRNIVLFPYFNFFRGFRPVAPVFWIYLAQVFGSYTIAMSYLSLGTICMALFEVPTGIFSDKIGRRKTMILGALFACLESFFYIVAFLSGNSHFLYSMAIIFIALSWALYSGTDEDMVYESISELKKKKKFHHAQGKFQSFVMFSWAISALVGGGVAEISFLLVFSIQLLAQIIALATSFFLIEPKKHKEEKVINTSIKHFITSFKHIIANKKLKNLTIGRVIDAGSSQVNGEFRQVFLKTIVPMWIIGLARFLKQIVGTFGFWFAGKTIDKFGNFKIVVGSNLLTKTIGLIAVLISNIFTPFIFVLHSFIRAPYKVAYSKLVQQEFTQRERATAGSIISLFVNIFIGVFSILAGYLADITSPKFTIIILILTGMIASYFYSKALKQ